MDDLDVHIDDITDAFILLAEEALKPGGGKAQWGEEGYYFCEAGEFVSFLSMHLRRKLLFCWELADEFIGMGRCFSCHCESLA